MLLSWIQSYMATSVKGYVLKVDKPRATDKKEDERCNVRHVEEEVHCVWGSPVNTRF